MTRAAKKRPTYWPGVLSRYIRAERAKKPGEPLCTPVTRLTCRDGFKMSVQASQGHYCGPRVDDPHFDLIGGPSPWYEFEIGMPNRVERALLPWAEDRKTPTSTVYGYVPAHVIGRVIERHGGCVVLDRQERGQP